MTMHTNRWTPLEADAVLVTILCLALKHTDALLATWNEVWHAAGPDKRGQWDFANFATEVFVDLSKILGGQNAG